VHAFFLQRVNGGAGLLGSRGLSGLGVLGDDGRGVLAGHLGGGHLLATGARKYGVCHELAEQVDSDVLEKVSAVAAETGAEITVSSDPACLGGADVIYTDIWASMGEEDQIPERVRMLSPFKVTEEMMAQTGNPDCLFMHCLPSFHNFETNLAAEQFKLGYDIREVTEEVFEGRHSVVFDEAENRLHSIKAVIVATIGE
jgi:ornithine carbamoyltransferase